MALHGNDIAGVNGSGIIHDADKDFIIAKVGEGLSYRDTLFSSFRDTARKRSQLFGGYWFAWPTFPAATCAANFVDFADLRPGEVLALDFEPFTVRSKLQYWNPAAWPEWVINFRDVVNRLTGASVWLYGNDWTLGTLMHYASHNQRRELHQMPLWKAGWNNTYNADNGPGDLHGWPVVTMWQWNGTHIDKDIFYGDANTWHLLGIPGKEASRDETRKPPKRKPRKQIPFPLPRGHAYAVNDDTIYTHSGVRSHDRNDIRRIQRKVGTKADGRFGPITKRHVERWQKDHKLKPDGEVGVKTWRKMF